MAAVADPLVHEDGSFAQEKPGEIFRRRHEDRVDFIDEFRGKALVGIEIENPLTGQREVVESPIPLCRVVLEVMVRQGRAVHLGDFDGSIGAAGVDDEKGTP